MSSVAVDIEQLVIAERQFEGHTQFAGLGEGDGIRDMAAKPVSDCHRVLSSIEPADCAGAVRS
jgi:hypothetical protein